VELRVAAEIAAPAAAAWRVLGERFGQVGEWATPIIASSLDGEPAVGAVRTCRVSAFGPIAPGEVKERLVAFDAAAMSLAYEAAAGMPRFIASAVNRWSVQPLGEARCLVRSHATVELRGPMALLGFALTRRMEAEGARVLEELRHMVEHGRPHTRKVAAMRPRSR
jgi:hypothetical protein